MAKINQNSLLAGASGKIGNIVIVHRKDGTVYLRRKSELKPKPTPAREEQQSRLAQASAYASAALADPAKRPIYEAAVKGTGKSPQNAAVRDRMRAPVIEDMNLDGYTGRKGETIQVLAKDDVGVAELWVAIRAADKTVLEEGAATQLSRGSSWRYIAQQDLAPSQIVRIEARATDHAGNSVSKSFPHQIRG